jgi:hypothetical protein
VPRRPLRRSGVYYAKLTTRRGDAVVCFFMALVAVAAAAVIKKDP